MSRVDATGTVAEVLSLRRAPNTQGLDVAIQDGKIVWADTSRWTDSPNGAIPDGAVETTAGELAGPPTAEYMESLANLNSAIENAGLSSKYWGAVDFAGGLLGTVGGVLMAASFASMAYDANRLQQAIRLVH